MAMIAVDPEKQSDQFYRYKMPRVIIKGEGNGNGIKTVIVNIEEICQRLGRDVNYVMKFFAYELAATAKFKDEKWILTGSHTQERVQQCTYDFIKKFLLCKSCFNPETIIQVDERKDVWLNCKACASVTPVDPREKLTNQIAKSEQPVKMAGKKKASKLDKKEKSKDEKEEEEYNKGIRHATESDDIELPAGENTDLPNPVDVLREYIAASPVPSDSEIVGKILDIKQDYNFKDKQVILMLFQALFDLGDVAELIPRWAKLLQRVLKPDTEKYIITGLELLCAEKEDLKLKFPRLLKLFHDHSIVSEEPIFSWHATKVSSKGSIDKATQKLFREKCAPLIEWLKEDEGDEDEEESGSEEEESPKGSPTTPTKAAQPKAKKQEEEDFDIDAI